MDRMIYWIWLSLACSPSGSSFGKLIKEFDDAKDIYDADLKGAVAIVIGSEGEGISRLVLEKCDFKVKIPMKGDVNSLNASVAAALFIYEAVRQNRN